MKIESILDQRTEFLNFAKNKSLMPGNIIKILKYQKIADTVEVQVEKKPKFSLGFNSADKIMVSG